MIGGEIVLAGVNKLSLENKNRAKVFTSNGTFVVPNGVRVVFITATAAGDAGARGTDGFDNGTYKYFGAGGSGGRGGQRVINHPIAVTPGQSISVTVGTGNTVFGEFLTLIKGKGAPGEDGSAPTESLGGKGGKGGGGLYAQTGGRNGTGGTDYAGGAPRPASPGESAQGVYFYGAGGGGGGGGGTFHTTGGSGGAGGPGILIVRW